MRYLVANVIVELALRCDNLFFGSLKAVDTFNFVVKTGWSVILLHSWGGSKFFLTIF